MCSGALNIQGSMHRRRGCWSLKKDASSCMWWLATARFLLYPLFILAFVAWGIVGIVWAADPPDGVKPGCVCHALSPHRHSHSSGLPKSEGVVVAMSLVLIASVMSPALMAGGLFFFAHLATEFDRKEDLGLTALLNDSYDPCPCCRGKDTPEGQALLNASANTNNPLYQ